MTSGRNRAALLGLLLLLFGLSKASISPGLGRNALDGDFYFQIARNVSEGNGLTTNVSLYHQGLKSFPAKVSRSPLWPLTLGLSGKVASLETMAELLPEVLFLLDLLLLYLLTNRLVRHVEDESGPGRLRWGPIDLGHIAVLLMGTNRVFFEFTSVPYTEGLAFFFLFSALLTMDVALERRNVCWAAAAGMLAGLTFLTRAQLWAAAGVIPALFIIAAARDRVHVRTAVAASAGAALVGAGWAAYLLTWLDSPSLYQLAGLGGLRETPELAPFNSRAPDETILGYLSSRLRGLLIALDPRSPDSYVWSFGWVVFVVPLALLQLIDDRRAARRMLRWLTSTTGALALAMLISAIGALGPLHLTRFRFFKEWLFGWRHGLPFILLVVLALALLSVRAKRWGFWVVVALVLGSLVTGVRNVDRLLSRRFASGLLGGEKELVEWLDSQSPKPTVVTTNAQPLSVFSRANFHWMECREPSSQTRALLEHAGADYVLMYSYEGHCDFLKNLDKELAIYRVFRGRTSVAVLKPIQSRPASESADSKRN